jgi:hypothetical protein
MLERGMGNEFFELMKIIYPTISNPDSLEEATLTLREPHFMRPSGKRVAVSKGVTARIAPYIFD